MQVTNIDTGEERPQINSDRANARQFDDVLSRCLPLLHRMASENWVTLWTRKTQVQEAPPLTNTWISSMAERKCRRG